MPARTITLSRQLGIVVRDRRKSLNITQAQLAERSRTSRRLITSLELGEADGIALSNVLRILDVLDMDLSVTWQESVHQPQADQPKEPSVSAQESRTASYQEAFDSIVAASVRQLESLEISPEESR